METGQTHCFVWPYRSKESLIGDMATDSGKGELSARCAAVVLIQNHKPDVIDRLGFGQAKLYEAHGRPGVVMISGFDEEGPPAGRKVCNLPVQPEGGLSSITSGPGPATRAGISVIDIATGETTLSAVLKALIIRSVAGQEADSRASMFEGMADWPTVPFPNHERGNSRKRLCLAQPSIAPNGVFRTRDGGDILVWIESDRIWAKFATLLLKRREAATDDRFATNVTRVRSRTDDSARVPAAFASTTRDRSEDTLCEADDAFAMVNDKAGVSAHTHRQRITIDGSADEASYASPAPVFTGKERHCRRVPATDEHAQFPSREKVG